MYKYAKREDEELEEIVRESMAAVEDIKKDLSESRMESDITARWEKAFVSKVKTWIHRMKQ